VRYLFGAVLLLVSIRLTAQLEDPEYLKLRSDLVAKFQNSVPGKFGHFVRGVNERIVTQRKILALTFDACGGPRGNGFDQELIDFLSCEKIPATVFLNGRWIDNHLLEVKRLAEDTLFEIENHGLTHRPCSINGKSMYGIEGTCDVGDAVDEIEINAEKIECLTNRKPVYYRSGTATTDEACGIIAKELGETIISYDVLSGDAVAGTPAAIIADNIVKKARNGAIIIMHMNHPEWNGYEALTEAIPMLRKMGYSFVKLQHHTLQGKH
jgi:peptidoglycan/xylan/chitin deacetylase (PgdA/CDA1 family)